ncbi:hypothetical protein BCR37DRAFT_379997 [Protomyces lactucae-debilis]|uniref:Pal1 cell morphology protein-domain-containing protein n=1 Tax=Protomyces lactucae-debilis TaxID=2754530 RepID=A0A1Y2FGY4_PROLT|nr:uncharacterized protein BCR37DRAFT_379997 [Protomyces lactucae-debilis]ORY82075.1 hypothetical protein BCR37DRAFT_379997 [Protomyces lactucae-debilis]
MRPAPALRSSSFDPTIKVDPIHGYETTGLGTSTFLEGAPASRAAMMARTHSDSGNINVDAGEGSAGRPRATSDHASGLGRKKSVIQRIRGAYKTRQESGGIGAGPSSTGPPGAGTPSDRGTSSPPAYASIPGAQQTEYFDMKGPVATGSSTASPSHTGPPLRKIHSDLQDAPGYSDLEEEDEVAASSAHGSDPTASLSPLYRPASKTDSANGQAGPGLLGRVRSLRVGGGKRRE